MRHRDKRVTSPLASADTVRSVVRPLGFVAEIMTSGGSTNHASLDLRFLVPDGKNIVVVHFHPIESSMAYRDRRPSALVDRRRNSSPAH